MQCKQNQGKTNEFIGLIKKHLTFYVVTHVSLKPYTYINNLKVKQQPERTVDSTCAQNGNLTW